MMKTLWTITLSPPGEVSPVDIRADSCEISGGEALIFLDRVAGPYSEKVIKAMFAPGQWVLVERICEEPEESENAANYAYKELEKDD